MLLSPFFYHLHSAYSSELQDMALDTEGTHVLGQRLAHRREELDFLLTMLETSPEMVAVLFHRGFQFHHPARLEHLLTLEPEDLPDWGSLADDVSLAQWTRPLVEAVRAQPRGDWFLTVAAALEYWQLRQEQLEAEVGDADDDESDEERQERESQQAGADWLAEQGFERKE